jgi:hypothetical protein
MTLTAPRQIAAHGLVAQRLPLRHGGCWKWEVKFWVKEGVACEVLVVDWLGKARGRAA